MLFRDQRDPVVIKALPSAAKVRSAEAERLADKFASRIEWMQRRGITGRLEKSKLPGSTRKPLPGTVIYFSRSALRI